MTAQCHFGKCMSNATYLVCFQCTRCPVASRDHEEPMCEKHAGAAVRSEAVCSFCKGSISVASYERLPKAGYQGSEVAEQRITDADRNRAIELLGEAFAVGKLTKDEFDLRADRASVARVQSALDRELSDVKSSNPVWMKTEQQGKYIGYTSGNNLVPFNVLISVLLAVCIIASMVAILV